MAVVTSDFLQAVLTGLRTTFNEDFSAARNGQDWRRATMIVDSSSGFETHSWLGSVPKMAEADGDMILEDPDAYNYTIRNKTFKAGFPVKRDVFEDDRLNIIRPKVAQLADEAARHPGELIFGLARDGSLATSLAFDNVAFFADTRVLGDSANIDNIRTGTGITVAQILADLSANRGVMRKFQDDKGRPMNLVANAVMVPAELEGVMYQALQDERAANASPAIPAEQAIISRGYPLIVNPYLTDANDWYLLHVSPSLAPFVLQDRLAPALEGVTSPESESGVIRDQFIYSARARYNVGYGDPRCAIRITN